MTSSKTIFTGTAALAMAGAMLLATTSLSEAQRAPRERVVQADSFLYGPGGYYDNGYRYYGAPNWAFGPRECFTEDAGGRLLPCDYSGGN